MKTKPNIQLTNDIVENIKLMAPYFDQDSQNQVFGIMFGIYGSIIKKNDKSRGMKHTI